MIGENTSVWYEKKRIVRAKLYKWAISTNWNLQLFITLRNIAGIDSNTDIISNAWAAFIGKGFGWVDPKASPIQISTDNTMNKVELFVGYSLTYYSECFYYYVGHFYYLGAYLLLTFSNC